MKPDEKYMPSKYRSGEEDLKFVPFNTTSKLSGWLPVSFFDAPSTSSMKPQMNSQLTLPSLDINAQPISSGYNQYIDKNPSSMGYNQPMNSVNQYNQLIDTNPSSMGYNQPITSVNPYNQPIDTNPSSMGYNMPMSSGYTPNLINNPNSNINQGNLYPDITNQETLYSYNKNTKNNTMTTPPAPENPIPKSTTPQRTPADLLRDINLDLDEDNDIERCCKDENINKLYKEIEKDCPGILSLMQAYNIPVPIAKLIIKRIVKISMQHCKK